MFTNDAEARAYLRSLSNHPDRPGDTDNLHPQMAINLANSIQQARNEGIPARLFSGYREGEATGSAFDMAGRSAHSYGLGSDVGGLGGAGSPSAMRFYQIAQGNNLHNPYGPQNGSEFNHYQLIPQEMKPNDPMLARLQAGKAQGRQQMWNAYSADTATPGQAGGQTPPPLPAQDNRQIVFQALVQKAGLSPQQALGVLWSLGGESHSNLDTRAVNPNDPGGAIGIAQWTGGSGRRQKLEAYAQQMGLPVTNIYAQTGFLIHEITEGDYKGALPLLKGAGSAQDATRIWTTKVEVPHNAAQAAEARIAQGARVGSLDAQGGFVPGSAAAITSGEGGATPAATGGSDGRTPPAYPNYPGYTPMTPEQRFGQSIGQALGSISAPPVQDAPDQPAIRSIALDAANMVNTPNPVPQQFAQGMPPVGAPPGSIGAQLGQLATAGGGQPPDSITAGAPSMTSMLGGIGTPAEFNYLDPRRTISPTLEPPKTRMA